MKLEPTFSSLAAQVERGERALNLSTARELARLAVASGVYTRGEMDKLRSLSIMAPKGDAVGRAFADSFGVAGQDATYNRARENLNPAGWSDVERAFPVMRFFAPANFIEATSRFFGGDGRAPYVRIDESVRKSLHLHTENFVRDRTIGREALQELVSRYPNAYMDETGHYRPKPDVQAFYDKHFQLIDIEKIDPKEPLKAVREYLEQHYGRR